MTKWLEKLHGFVNKAWVKETLLVVPRIALLIPKLLRDERVPKRTKLALTGLAMYLVSPWDLIPDFIPGLGQLDDAIVVLLLVDGILNQVDDHVLQGHWTGEAPTLRRVQSLSRMVAHLVPNELKRYLYGKAIASGQEPDRPLQKESAHRDNNSV
jgi:uncharacterized membrane protein YkvA (DUF1232 family)